VTVRRSIAAAAVLLTAPVLSSCGVNFGAQTDQPYNPAVGVDNRDGSVDVLNALIVSGTNGSGTVVATLVNNDQQQKDTLSGVTGQGKDKNVQVKVSGPTEITPDGLLNLATKGGISATGKRIVPGNFVTLQFTFQNGDAVTVDAPVVSQSNPDYSDVKVPS